MIQVNYDCDKCKKVCDIEDLDILCYTCKRMHEDELIDIFDLKECIKETLEDDQLWTDKEYYLGDITEEEKEIYMRGVKFGYMNAIFSICSNYDLVEYYEELTDE